MPFCIGWVENFAEITLFRTVKEIEANLCFAIFYISVSVHITQRTEKQHPTVCTVKCIHKFISTFLPFQQVGCKSMSGHSRNTYVIV